MRFVDNLEEITGRPATRVERTAWSPCFPSVGEARERLLKRREQLVARTFLALLIGLAPLLGFLGYGMPAVVVSVVGVLGFVATCFYAGNRQTNRMERGA